jgi:hypothetical protein
VDLAPCDSYLFPKMKSVLKGLIFSVSLRWNENEKCTALNDN